MAASNAVINGILKGIGAPVNANTTAAMQEWIAAEGGSNNNWLNVSPGGKLASYANQAQGIAATVATIKQSNMAGIANSLQQGLSPDEVKSAVIASPWSEDHYQGTDYGGGATNATLTADVTTTGGTTGGAPNIGTQADAKPVAGANVKNFHGFDLSSFMNPDGSAGPNLGNAEKAIMQYVANPNAKDANGQTFEQRIGSDFGYTTNYINQIPAAQKSGVMATLIWASQYLDPSAAPSKAEFASQIAKTDWWNQTTQYQRAWENLLGTDPDTAHKLLGVAQDKVLGIANQIGVKLTSQQLDSIANMYASQTYTPTNTYSSMSGTSPEWLDQAVVAAITSSSKGGASDLMAQGTTATNPGSLTGIAADLYQQFQQAAQSYLLYNPSDPTKSLMDQQTLMNQVNQALQSYTGTGASGQISQFEAGALNAFTEQLKQKASQLYPSLAGAIAQGTAPADYVKPEQTVIANTLGLDPASIDFTSPTWNWAIATPDPKTGVKTALTSDQILQKITDPNFTFQGPGGQTMTYDQTNTAVQNAHGVASSLASMFGIGGL